MKALLVALGGGFQAELKQLSRSRLFVALTIIQAITFLFLASLFGMTGSFAPTAIVTEDKGKLANDFITTLNAAHHSFDLHIMDTQAAQSALHRGDLVAIITIPQRFSEAIARGEDTTIHVDVDNVNTDMTDDIQRALPSAIVAFGHKLQLPHLHVQVAEHDLIDHDTGFIPYLVVSGLALDAFVIACILSAMAVAREFEAGTMKLLAVAPVHPLFSLLGRVLATDLVAAVAMVFPVAVTIVGYRIVPLHPFEMLGVILLCIIIFSCVGVALGAILKRTLPVASLVFGLSLPLYLCSGSYEPQRFDGNLIWALAHLSPVYYAVGILQQAFHGLQVTPEAISSDFIALLTWAVCMLLLAGILLRGAMLGRAAIWQREKQQKQQHLRRAGSWLLQKQRFVLAAHKPLVLLALFVLIAGGIWFNVLQSLSLQKSQQQQAAVELAAAQRQDTSLLDYINFISDLLAHDNLLNTKKGDAATAIANARTQELLQQLDADRKVTLIRFLYDARLIKNDYKIISLQGADLRAVHLANVDLNDINLAGVNFSGADLHGADLSAASLASTNFSGANLSGANLSRTNMRDTDVSHANLTNANLQYAIVEAVQLEKAGSLAGATLPDGSVPPAGLDQD
ncbi:hypothetical protein EPA93_15850 [Ktedonosporobacter rubrisoli]|uniref:ABC-2 type transporter transmembrane domain-containing protein n=1 Tax=Ktedonosporobacter rubrisoli TaxID=2509675 RepID=A0A4P6JPS5_KTERU|nr:ABC transporter permease [Ktedonosporobacter rubrisoli]QBD77387.1 hypothetical protein EPA93_15850 [Ktedonosporobacter rubrisoli]